MSRRRWSRLASEKGSAVAEFALLAFPLCLSTIACANYCLNVYIDTLFRASAISTARFASLADTTLGQARQIADKTCKSGFAQVIAKCELAYVLGHRQVAEVHMSYKPLSLLVFEQGTVNIVATVGLEEPKR